MTETEIEVSIGVDVSAMVAFRVERSEWESLDNEAKQKAIGQALDLAAAQLQRDVIPTAEGFISMEIIGPVDKDINLGEVQVYDPSEG